MMSVVVGERLDQEGNKRCLKYFVSSKSLMLKVIAAGHAACRDIFKLWSLGDVVVSSSSRQYRSAGALMMIRAAMPRLTAAK